VSPPLFVLGVRRSGTTLLRLILDRSEGIAIPDESHFIPQLAHRNPAPVDRDRFVDDLRRVPTLRRWELSIDEVEPLLLPVLTTGDAIAAVFEAYATKHGKPRWGDKTPAYMRYLSLLERLFPDALFVHLIRDGRDCALSFLSMPDDAPTRTWAYPTDVFGVACQWATEIRDARGLGRRVGASRYLEVRYEELVTEPERVVRDICAFADVPYAPAMLAPEDSEIADRPHHMRLREAPSKRRDWATEMSAEDVESFEVVAGPILAELGYELRGPRAAQPNRRGKAALAWYRTRIEAWKAAAYVNQRSPLWRRRHPRVD
jgi:Sulfotransferase family